MNDKATLETFYRVYNDMDGSFWEIRPDADALNCVSIQYYGESGAADHPLLFSPAVAILVADAMRMQAEALKPKE